jgi:hypothetical protein
MNRIPCSSCRVFLYLIVIIHFFHVMSMQNAFSEKLPSPEASVIGWNMDPVKAYYRTHKSGDENHYYDESDCQYIEEICYFKVDSTWVQENYRYYSIYDFKESDSSLPKTWTLTRSSYDEFKITVQAIAYSGSGKENSDLFTYDGNYNDRFGSPTPTPTPTPIQSPNQLASPEVSVVGWLLDPIKAYYRTHQPGNENHYYDDPDCQYIEEYCYFKVSGNWVQENYRYAYPSYFKDSSSDLPQTWTLTRSSYDEFKITAQAIANPSCGKQNSAVFEYVGNYNDRFSGPTPTPTPLIGHGPETHYFPFSSKRNDDELNHKFFPIGWGMFIHDVDGVNDPANRQGEWSNGTVAYLYNQGCSYVNTLFFRPINRYIPWGFTYEQRPRDQHTTTYQYLRMFDYLESLNIQTNGQYNFKGYPILVDNIGPPKPTNTSTPVGTPTPTGSPTPSGTLTPTSTPHMYYNIHSAGSWRDTYHPTYDPTSIPNMPNGDDEILVHRVNTLENEPQLGGWLLADEPYEGALAWQVNQRENIYGQLIDKKDIIEITDDNINNHPFHCIVRGNGNYNFYPSEHEDWVHLLYELDIADYIHDDLYICDYNLDHGDGDYWIRKCKTRTEQAVRSLLQPEGTAPNNNIKSWLLWAQGMGYEDVNYNDAALNLKFPNDTYQPIPNPSSEYGFMTTEQLRYVIYTPWINGAQGAMFWELSKSDSKSFTRANQIMYEAGILSKYLLQPDAGIAATITSSNDDNSTVQFILRRDPDFDPSTSEYLDKILILISNNSLNTSIITVQFPATHHIGRVESAFIGYSEYAFLDQINNKFDRILYSLSSTAYFIYIDD